MDEDIAIHLIFKIKTETISAGGVLDKKNSFESPGH